MAADETEAAPPAETRAAPQPPVEPAGTVDHGAPPALRPFFDSAPGAAMAAPIELSGARLDAPIAKNTPPPALDMPRGMTRQARFALLCGAPSLLLVGLGLSL
jgi:hypothetical protein